MENPPDPRDKPPTPPRTPAQRRDARLAAALKANIARRKTQAGARTASDEDNDNNTV